MTEKLNVHATGLVLNGTGLLLRGPAGSGKSLRALSLLDEWEMRGLPGTLVSDDRVDLALEAGVVVMTPPRPIEGLIELRGRGLVTRPFARKAPLHLVVDMVESLERMPEDCEFETGLMGVRLARCPVPKDGVTDARHQLLLVREGLRRLSPGNRPFGQQLT